MYEDIVLNKYQTPISELGLDKQPQEVQDQFWDFFHNVPFIQSMVSPNKPRACDLPRDSDGKIIVDITKPHIIEDIDYFRLSAIHYQKYGRFTDLRPNANPNSEFGKWIREERRRCLYGYVRPSDGEWITGDHYFFLNYCPISLLKKSDKDGRKAMRVIDFPFFWDGHYYKFHYLNQAREAGYMAAELASRQKGKAHPYNEIVYTPDGVKLWGDIKIGDKLFGPDGDITTVVDIPFDGVAPIYEVEFYNGKAVRCSEGHLWKVKSHMLKRELVISTKDLLDLYKRPRHYVPKRNKEYELDCTVLANNGVDFAYKETLVDPYTFGLMLGDGCFKIPTMRDKAYFSASDEDFEIYKKYIPYNWFKYNNTKYGYNLNIPNFKSILYTYGLYFKKSEEKFIPDEYKYNSRDVRISVLKGIFDADATVNKAGCKIELALSSERMIDDVMWICASLGIITTKKRVKHTYYIKDGERIECLDSYRLSIFSNIELFNLPRKLDIWRKRSTTNYGQSKYRGLKISNIRYVGEEKSKCVTVDNESHCYLIGDFITTHNSFSAASMLAKRFILGESFEVNKRVVSYITAIDKAKLLGGDQTLDKFQFYIDFIAEHMQWPSRRLFNSLADMNWQMGYKDLNTGTNKGTLNSVVGKSSQADASKLRGSRGVLYLFEEAGTFDNLLTLWNNLLPSVSDGDSVYGLLYAYGTTGDVSSDFAAMQEIMYNPVGYKAYGVKNVFDKEGQGRPRFTFFFPAYMNMSESYDKNGNSDVTKALMKILLDRYEVKYNSTDVNTITKRIAEMPITPQEALLRSRGNMFPVADLTQRLNEIDNNPKIFDDVYVGDLIQEKDGTVSFKITGDQPIRDFPLKDNKVTGALEIFKMPEKDAQGKVFSQRYIIGHDPVDNDEADTMSLSSTFVLDLWTDIIVAEYTGRHQFADDNFEMLRKLCVFYNAKCLYESNVKGAYSYFSRMNCLYLLADTPEYLKDKDIIKNIGVGNNSKGVKATKPVNDYANRLIRDWLLKPVIIQSDNDGEETTVFNLTRIRNRALIKELMLYNPDINVDRVRALGLLMLYREQFMVTYNGDPSSSKNVVESDYLGNDDYFTRNYDNRLRKHSDNVTDS